MPASIVIPAHNEAALIGRLLSALRDESLAGWETVVVCNGCTDDTAELARAFDGVRVIETPVGGKNNALNLGDDEATLFPRLYVDADTEVDAATLRALADTVDDPTAVVVASPRLIVDASASARAVRIYFSVWCRLRYAQEAVGGSGAYALSPAARARFERFPERGGDDQLIYRLFDASERRVSSAGITVQAPRTLGALIRSRARMSALNAELERTMELPDSPTLGWRAQGLEKLVARGPRMALRVAVFLAVQVTIRSYGRRLAAGGEIPWNQDRTTRA